MNGVRNVAVALVFVAAPAWAAEVEPIVTIQGFDEYDIGTTDVPMSTYNYYFGVFTGGTVEFPGISIDPYFQLGTEEVYYGTELTYTNMFDDYHCCAWFSMEFMLTTIGDVLIEYYSHDETEFGQQLMYSSIANGQQLIVRWGDRGGWQEPPGNGDITTIRWISLDGSPFAIDDVIGVGPLPFPEPGTWAMMIGGFGLAGIALRRRRAVLA